MEPRSMPTKKKPQPAGKQELILHLKSMARLPDGTEVAPGANQVSAAVIEMCRQDTLMRKWLAKGLITIRDHVPEPGSREYDLSLGLPMSLLGLSLETIREAIAMCQSRPQLTQWLNDAGDPEVRTLLIDRSYAVAIDEAAKQATQGAN